MKSRKAPRLALFAIFIALVIAVQPIAAHAATVLWRSGTLSVNLWVSSGYSSKTGGKTQVSVVTFGALAWIRLTGYGTASAYEEVSLTHPRANVNAECKWNAGVLYVAPGTRDNIWCYYYS